MPLTHRVQPARRFSRGALMSSGFGRWGARVANSPTSGSPVRPSGMCLRGFRARCARSSQPMTLCCPHSHAAVAPLDGARCGRLAGYGNSAHGYTNNRCSLVLQWTDRELRPEAAILVRSQAAIVINLERRGARTTGSRNVAFFAYSETQSSHRGAHPHPRDRLVAYRWLGVHCGPFP
jgi:hypothetical protein